MKEYIFKSSSQSWLNKRNTLVQGTEIAALFGLDKNQSIAKVLLNKSEPPAYFDNPFMKNGRLLEPLIIQLLNEYKFPVRPASDFGTVKLLAIEELRIGCSLDAIVDKPNKLIPVECKSTNERLIKEWLTTHPPLKYLLQCQTQIMICGAPHGALACVFVDMVEFRGVRLPHYYLAAWKVNENLEIQELIASEVARFWKELDLFKVNPEIKERVRELAITTMEKIFVDKDIELE